MPEEDGRNLSKRDLRRELMAGLAAMLVAAPAAIAFGVAAYAPMGPTLAVQGALAGLVGAVSAGLIAPPLGGTPRLISAPAAPGAAVIGALVAGIVSGTAGTPTGLDPAQVRVLLAAVALMAAVLQFIYGALGGGRLMKYIPYPVVSGYLTGVGVIICMKQLPALFGFPKSVSPWVGLFSPDTWQWQGLAVGTASMVVMLVGPRLTKKLPAVVLALAGGILAYLGLAMMDPALRQLSGNPLVIGPVAGGLRGLRSTCIGHWAALPSIQWSTLRPLLASGVTLSVLLSIDTLKTCVVVDAVTRSRHNSNRELIGQGVANTVAALVGGLPCSGTLGPTLVNIGSGGTSRLSSWFAGAFALIALLALMRWLGWIPLAALAGILLVIGFRLIDRSSFLLLKHKSTILDFGVIAAVVVVAVMINLIAAAGAGVGLAILLFIRDQIQGSVIRRKLYADSLFSKQYRLPSERALLEQCGHRTVICQLQGNLFFGTTDQLFAELEPDIKTCRNVIFDMSRVQGVDFTAAHMLEQIEAMLSEQDGNLILSNIPDALPTGQDLQKYFDQLHIGSSAHGVRSFETLDDALEWTEDRTLEEQGALQQHDEQPLDLADFDLTRSFDKAALKRFRRVAEERSCAPDEVLLRKKDKGDEIFLIRRGKVRIILPLEQTGKHHHVATFGRGDFFGEIAFLTGKKRTAHAIANGTTDLYVFSRSRFGAFCRKRPETGVMILERLAHAVALRLRDADKELRRLKDS